MSMSMVGVLENSVKIKSCRDCEKYISCDNPPDGLFLPYPAYRGICYCLTTGYALTVDYAKKVGLVDGTH